MITGKDANTGANNPVDTESNSLRVVNYVWDTNTLAWIKQTAAAGSGGGGPVTIADGADVAQGTTTDLDTANTVVGRLKKLVTLLTGTIAVSGTFWQATQPVSGTVTANLGTIAGVSTEATLALVKAKTDNLDVLLSTRLKPADTLVGVTTVAVVTTITNALPAGTNRLGSVRPVDSADADLTAAKGTQTARFVGVTEAKDAGRVNIAWTIEVAGAATAEALATVTESRDGAATSTFTSKVVTSGKRLRITSMQMAVETLGSGTAPQRVYLRMRFNTAGAVTTASPIQTSWECANNPAVVKTGTSIDCNFPDGIEFLGDGTKQIGFTLTFPDWVTTTATVQTKITITAFEY